MSAYADASHADAYHADHPYGDAWFAETPARRARLRTLATALLDRHYTWRGEPAAASQDRAWPRKGLATPQGEEIEDDAIPAILADACAEFARHLATTDRTADVALIDMDIRSASGTGFGGGAVRRVIPSAVADMIPSAWGSLRSSRGSVDLERV